MHLCRGFLFALKLLLMIILLSPAKTLDFKRQIQSIKHSEPTFLAEANSIVKKMQTYSIPDLLSVMSMSENLAQLTFERFQNWDNADVEEKQAGAAFKGEAYNGLDLPSLNGKDLDFAQKHLRILSGVYGVLRPYDLIKPYRLEMGSKLKDDSLYTFWKEKLTICIEKDLSKYGENLLNLASQEYFSALDHQELSANLITPVFKEQKGDKLKTIVVYTKKARGMMARYIIENRITNTEDIKRFDYGNYRYSEELSTDKEWFFVR